MKERYGKKKKTRTFEIRAKVTVRIPKIDRATTGMHRLPCIIVNVRGKKYFLYRLQCEYGVLDTWFSDGDLEVYPGSLKFNSKDWKILSFISLHEASKKANPKNHYGQPCNCKKRLYKKELLMLENKQTLFYMLSFWEVMFQFSEDDMVLEVPSPKHFKAEKVKKV